MGRAKGIFFEHKQFILRHLKGKQKQLLAPLLRQGLIQHWENTEILGEDDHDALRSIFDLIEHRDNESQFVKILRSISDETADLVEEPPGAKFVIPLLKTKNAKIGDKVVLECELEKKYTTKWLKNKQELKDDKNISITHLNGTHTLSILNFKRSDIADYSCICGTAETRCELKIEEQIRFVKGLDDNTCLKGDTVILQCKLNVPYYMEPVWTKDGQNIPESNTYFKKENTPSKKKLTLLNVRKNDAGIYKCACDTASTEATIKISAVKESQLQASLTYAELEQRYRELEEKLENEKITVKKLEIEREALIRQVGELKHDSEYNKDRLRTTEEKISGKNIEIDSNNVIIESLTNRVETYKRELQKKEKKIENLSDGIEKLIESNKQDSNKKREQESKINKMIEGFECYSNLQKERESDRKQHAQSLLEMTEESQNAKTEREKAEKYVRKAEMEKKMFDHEKEMFAMKIKTLEEETIEIRKHKDALQDQQKLNLTGLHKNLLLGKEQQEERKKIEIQLKQANAELEKVREGKQKAEDNAQKAIHQKQLLEMEHEYKTKQMIQQMIAEKQELLSQKQNVEADLKIHKQRETDEEAEKSSKSEKEEKSAVCRVS